jgi:cytochrome P450
MTSSMPNVPATSAHYSGRAKRSNIRPPGPPWRTAIHNTWYCTHDVLGFLLNMHKQYGDVVAIPTLFGLFYAIFHPDGVRRVLQENHLNYDKDVPEKYLVKRIFGEGLFVNEGASWLRQRRLIQPIFHRQKIVGFGQLMTETTIRQLEQWETSGFVETGKPFPLTDEITSLTLHIVGNVLFGTDLGTETECIKQAFTTMNHVLTQACYQPWMLSLPTPQRHRLYRARNDLYASVEHIIRERRRHPEGHDDLLTMLLQAQDEEMGKGMTDEQVRDEVMAFLGAGHETTATTLSWTFFLLAQYPSIEARLQEEYQRVLNGHFPAAEHLPQLPVTRMVIEEAMRLYPPVWSLRRRARHGDEIGGYFIPKGAYIWLPAYVTQRHPAFWEQPETFDPQRFSTERAAKRPRFAYFPFGGGPRLCIGDQFAFCAAELILATVLSRYHLRLLPDTVITPDPLLLTLRPRGQLLMTLHRITPAPVP